VARQPGRPGGEIPWEEIWQKIVGKKDGGGRERKPVRTGRIAWIVIGIVVVIWLLTGIYTVNPGEQGVVRQFGNHVGTTDPGLHYHLPGPIQRIDKVNVEEIRTTEVGFRTVERGRFELRPAESLMLTGDENIVDAQIVVQYRVRDAAAYLFNMRDPDLAVHAATEVALRSIVGRNTIDFVIIEGRSIVQDETMTFLQRLLDDYGSGLLITAVKLQFAGPPEEVKDAFDEVVRAREDKQRLIREAEGYAADRVPKARGEAEQAVKVAEAYKEQRVLRAEGDAAKFLKILREHEVPAAFHALADSGVSEAMQVLAKVGADKEGVAEEGGKVLAMTRETLGEILVGLGVAEEDQQPEELTGQKLHEALSQLGVAEEYEEAYREAMRLTRERLYLETIEDVLAGTEKFVVDPQTSGNLMPFLPLKELTGLEKPQEAKQ